jgi:hypothetical protein
MPEKTSLENVGFAAINTETARQAYIDLFAFAVGMDESIADAGIVRSLAATVMDVVREPMEHPADSPVCVSHSCPLPPCVRWRMVAAHVIAS